MSNPNDNQSSKLKIYKSKQPKKDKTNLDELKIQESLELN